MATLEKITCTLCGKTDTNGYSGETGELMTKHQICFGCAFWTEKAALAHTRESVRVKGNLYFIEDENSKCERGFGGQYHKIKFTSGRVVESTNLWYNGEVPEHFKSVLSDNAEFIHV